LRPSDAATGAEAIAAVLERRAAECARHELKVSLLTLNIGAAILLEPHLFWPDALDRFHRRNATEEQRRRYAASAARPAARAFAHALRGELGAALREAGAEHLQLGRYYPYLERLDPARRELMLAVKRALDPAGLMAPGALLPADSAAAE
jgi:D-lactate dehydrogenase (cytochrome)